MNMIVFECVAHMSFSHTTELYKTLNCCAVNMIYKYHSLDTIIAICDRFRPLWAVELHTCNNKIIASNFSGVREGE